MQHPASHVTDALTLTGADGKIDLYELTPSVGAGTLYFKADNTVTWRGTTYTGLPMSFSGEKDSATTPGETPRMQIGQPNIDLSLFKPLIRTGALDDAYITRKTVLLTDLLANNDIKVTRVYRVGVVENYSRTQISMLLRRFSGTRRATIPFRQYLPPEFPFVRL